jgi:putative membrane protein
MQCPGCGAVIAIGSQTCPKCRAPRPQIEPAFARAEQSYLRLREQYEAGAITADQFKAGVEAQRLEYDGRYWMLGVNSGQWYLHDGTSWYQQGPPIITASAHPKTPTPNLAAGLESLSTRPEKSGLDTVPGARAGSIPGEPIRIGANYLLIALHGIVNLVALILALTTVPGMGYVGVGYIGNAASFLLAIPLLAIVNALLLPLMNRLKLPVNLPTLGFFSFAINVLMLGVLRAFLPGFWVAPFPVALLLTAVSLVLNKFVLDRGRRSLH